jgi:hypothetical protein
VRDISRMPVSKTRGIAMSAIRSRWYPNLSKFSQIDWGRLLDVGHALLATELYGADEVLQCAITRHGIGW